jgi:phosphatidate phosphatase PAH1
MSCDASPTPNAGKVRQFRHAGNQFATRFSKPRHRGVDLIAVESDQKQTIGGKLAYGAIDNDIHREEVVLFACVDDEWKSLGAVETDRDGRFELTLTGKDRLPAGMRDLYGHVPGDGTGFRFLAYVATQGESVIVTDIDGTITESETAVFNTVVFGDDIGHRKHAPQVLANSGRVVVYLSARGDQLTEVTRKWLRDHGFPRGPIRHARALATKPGPKTVTFKTAALRDLGVPVFAAIGNRATDVEAYTRAGIPANKILIKLPGFDNELAGDLAARRAIAFTDYSTLRLR